MKISSKSKVDLLSGLVNAMFSVQRHLTPIIEINNRNLTPCIYAMWHAHQCCIFGLKDKSKVNVLISRSMDGEIIARATENLGFKTIRGSKGKKGSVEATMQMIERLKSGEDVAIMVDGPSGPNRIVKDGVIKIAQMAQVPIVPVVWYSPDIPFLQIPSWDKFTYPLGYTRLVNLYDEPIYIPEQCSDYDIEKSRKNLEDVLLNLETKVASEWKKAWGNRLWMKK